MHQFLISLIVSPLTLEFAHKSIVTRTSIEFKNEGRETGSVPASIWATSWYKVLKCDLVAARI
jgi:hypothetical protein